MTRYPSALSLLLILCILFQGIPAFSQEEELEVFEELKLYVGLPKTITVLNPKRVAVARPEIADVASIAVDGLTLEPKATGITSLFVWDDRGQHAYKLRVIREDLSLLREHADSIIRELNLSAVMTKVNESEGKILLIGEVKDLNEKERLLNALSSLKDKILDLTQLKEEETTLNIDVQVLEIAKDASRTLGFTMPSAISLSEPVNKFSPAFRKSLDAIFHIFDWPRASFSARLDALIQEGKARVLSSPRLACQSGKEAELLVGGEKPILTTTIAAERGATGTSVAYKEFGIKLKIRPTVLEDEQIKVDLNIEVSEVGDAEILGAPNAPTAKAFPLSKRSVSTELFMKSGQTLSIGGLVREKEDTIIKKTAFLGDIPILGMLFRRKETKVGGGGGEKGNIELVVLLTPNIVRPALSSYKKASYPKGFLEPSKQEGLISRRRAPYLDADIGAYTEDIKSRIANSIDYPGLARELQLKGTVKVRLRILTNNGELQDVYVIDSSGSQLLDNAAVKTIKKLSPFPVFPGAIDARELIIDAPIVYH
jgi:pilus assembly protein CpaC